MRRSARIRRSAALLALASALHGCHRSQPAAGPAIDVRVDVPETAAAEVEASITVPLERACANVAHVEHVRGASAPGRSSITVVFERGTDADAAMASLRDSLAQAAPLLPPAAPAPLVTRAHGPLAAVYVLRSNTIPLGALSDAAASPLTERIAQIEGVHTVVTCGDVVRRAVIDVDPTTLAAMGMTIADVAAAVPVTATNADAHALSSLVLGARSGAIVRLADVATVADDDATHGCRAYDGRGGVIQAAVYAQPGTDPVKLRARVDAALGQATKALPFGVEIRSAGPGRTLAVDLAPDLASNAAVAGLRDAMMADATMAGAEGTHFVVTLETPDGPDASPASARVALDTSDDAVVRRVERALALSPVVRDAIQDGATAEIVGSDRSALDAAAPAFVQALRDHGLHAARLGTERLASVAHVDRDAAARLGASTADIDLALDATHGKTLIPGGHGDTGVVLRMRAPLEHVYVKAASSLIPLSAVVTLRAEAAPRLLLRDDRQPAIGVRVQATDLGALQRAFAPPPGIAIHVIPD